MRTQMYKTRADLMTHPAFAGLETDSSGNPCVWDNFYEDEKLGSWVSAWSCQCDDDGVEPYDSVWIPPEEFYELWERLPEADMPLDAAQRHEIEQAAFCAAYEAANPPRLTTITVIVTERASPCPPVYPDPLIYVLDVVDINDEDEILALVAAQRAEDLGLDDCNEVAAGLDLQFAFAGDVKTLKDWRA